MRSTPLRFLYRAILGSVLAASSLSATAIDLPAFTYDAGEFGEGRNQAPDIAVTGGLIGGPRGLVPPECAATPAPAFCTDQYKEDQYFLQPQNPVVSVTVWEGYGEPPDSPSQSNIYGRVRVTRTTTDPARWRCSESTFRINNVVAGDQRLPRVAIRPFITPPAGGSITDPQTLQFMVVWNSSEQNADRVKYRRFSVSTEQPSGPLPTGEDACSKIPGGLQPQADELRLDTEPTAVTRDADVEHVLGIGFVAAYTLDAAPDQIKAAAFDGNSGARLAIGSGLQVVHSAEADKTLKVPRIAASNTRFAITWQSDGFGGTSAIQFRGFRNNASAPFPTPVITEAGQNPQLPLANPTIAIADSIPRFTGDSPEVPVAQLLIAFEPNQYRVYDFANNAYLLAEEGFIDVERRNDVATTPAAVTVPESNKVGDACYLFDQCEQAALPPAGDQFLLAWSRPQADLLSGQILSPVRHELVTRRIGRCFNADGKNEFNVRSDGFECPLTIVSDRDGADHRNPALDDYPASLEVDPRCAVFRVSSEEDAFYQCRIQYLDYSVAREVRGRVEIEIPNSNERNILVVDFGDAGGYDLQITVVPPAPLTRGASTSYHVKIKNTGSLPFPPNVPLSLKSGLQMVSRMDAGWACNDPAGSEGPNCKFGRRIDSCANRGRFSLPCEVEFDMQLRVPAEASKPQCTSVSAPKGDGQIFQNKTGRNIFGAAGNSLTSAASLADDVAFDVAPIIGGSVVRLISESPLLIWESEFDFLDGIFFRGLEVNLQIENAQDCPVRARVSGAAGPDLTIGKVVIPQSSRTLVPLPLPFVICQSLEGLGCQPEEYLGSADGPEFGIYAPEDFIAEGAEAFSFSVQALRRENDGDRNMGAPLQIKVTVVDEQDTRYLFGLEKSSIAVSESKGGVSVVVTRSRTNSEATSVDLLVSPMTAKAGRDYRPPRVNPVSVRFTASEDRKSVRIPLVKDDVGEPSKKFRVTLRNPQLGGQVDPNRRSAEITIRDDDR